MRNLDTLEEFLKTYEHPDISKEEVEKICKSVFSFVKHKIDDEEYDTIRLKYFGVFLIYPGKIKGLIKDYHRKFLNKYIGKEKYRKIRIKLEKLNLILKKRNNETED